MAKFNDLLDELRFWETDHLFAERERVLREQRQLETRELALTFVLDERNVSATERTRRARAPAA